MAEGFDSWKDKLEDANAEDVTGFDANATWQKLQPRIAKRPTQWRLAAAAVLIGLLLGAGITMLMSNQPQVQTVAVQPQHTTKETIVVHDTIVHIVPEPIIQQQHIAMNKTRQQSNSVAKKQQAVTTPEERIVVVAEPETIQPVEEAVATTTTKPKQRIIHLMDIENEDKKMMLSNPAPSQRQNVVYLFSSEAGMGKGHGNQNTSIVNGLRKN